MDNCIVEHGIRYCQAQPETDYVGFTVLIAAVIILCLAIALLAKWAVK